MDGGTRARPLPPGAALRCISSCQSFVFGREERLRDVQSLGTGPRIRHQGLRGLPQDSLRAFLSPVEEQRFQGLADQLGSALPTQAGLLAQPALQVVRKPKADGAHGFSHAIHAIIRFE